MQQFKGLPASPGIAIGPIWIYRPQEAVVERHLVADPTAEWVRLQVALAKARTQLQALESRARETIGEEEAEIFAAHQLFLADDDLLVDLRTVLRNQRLNAEAAVEDAFEQHAQALEALDEEYFRARAADVRDVSRRVLRCLQDTDDSANTLKEPSIIVADDLTPSDTVQFERANVLGLVTLKGGPTSHTAILARGLGIPAVVSVPAHLEDLRNGSLLILDGGAGELRVAPTLADLNRYKAKQAEWEMRRKGQLAAAHAPATTLDGHTVEVVVNIGGAEDARLGIENGAEGVGLFRTEFLYLDRETMPTEAEQIAAYRAAFKVMAGKTMVVRTLDIGGDKSVPYLGLEHEPNPFLGWRAIRMIRERPDVLEDQARALLLAAAETETKLHIMLPLVSSVGEVERAREIFAGVVSALTAAGRRPPEYKFGIMIEVPAAAVQADVFAPLVDFFSIGTNDLTQYTLAVDRGNERVAAIASPYHPAVLRLIKMTIDAAHAHGKWVGMCGELAGDELAAPLLLGLGLDEFSMVPAAIPAVKAAIRRWDLAQCREIAAHCLALPQATDIRTYLRGVAPKD
ncbi:MAG TPA: phosphoenolpyruvate--protein phosphotransferase [Anaerolineales bacterium]|nr:phosphoenolpyruvate--protein phosphotransferase [Anaerolineales bacterium]